METVLITGGSGFLGRELALKLKKNYKVILGSRNNGLNQEAQVFTNCEAIPLDVCSSSSVYDAFNLVKPDIVIHAGATKFVNISESQPMECIDVNVLGSQNIARISIEKSVNTVIGISTDKAAPPVNHIYGNSKALMEKMFNSLNANSDTNFSCVRFGNIAWSTGSVFPIWKQMMKLNKKIESTGPNMKRFFFSVTDAADLVIRNLNNIELTSGKILSMEMKASKISKILDVWTKLYGTPWVEINKRPGDTDHESMIGFIELQNTTEIILDSMKHFLTSSEQSKNHIKEVVSTEFADSHSEEEIIQLIKIGM